MPPSLPPPSRRSAVMSQPRAMQTDRYRSMGLEAVDGQAAWRLMVACTDGDLAAAEALLAGDPRLANVQFWYEIPLHYAVREGHTKLTLRLLKAGADPSTSCYCYYSWPRLLELAASRGWHELHACLSAEMNRRFGYDPGFESLAAALRAFDEAAVSARVREYPELAAASDAHGRGAIHWACLTHQLHLLDLLLEAGADLDRGDASGLRPIQQAILGSYQYRSNRVPEERRRPARERIEALLARGAELPLGVAAWLGDMRGVEAILVADPIACRRLESGRTSPLCYATMGGNGAAVECFLDLGADPNQPETLAPRGRALFEAAAANDLAIAGLLLARGADPNPVVDSCGTATGIVAHRHPDSCVPMQALLRRHGAVKADWELTTAEWKDFARAGDWTRIDAALDADLIEQMDTELLDLILHHEPGFARRLDGRSFRTPSVRFTARPPLLERLLAHGFDLDRGDWLGRTVLHYAALFGDTAMIDWLVARGADLHAEELDHGTTPLGMAAVGGHREAARLLLALGSDPARPADRPWARPAALAAAHGHPEVLELLAG